MTASPIVLSAEGGTLVQTGVARLVKASALDTDNAISFTVVTIGEGFGGPPVHRHLHHAETFYILDGSFRFVVDDVDVVVEAGAFIFVPPMTAHGFVGSGTMLELFTPGDFDGYFREVAKLVATGGSSADFQAAQAKYGMEVLGPPLAS